ncbi:MAG TPA: class I SAM-dependent methyltransferase [Stellaceae bacterium]|nr:class I SAM-dependent methyltransferase [Stellaceae bacterium]
MKVDQSYRTGSFRDNEDSLRRLRRQASIAVDLEMQHLYGAGLASGMKVMDLGCGPGIISVEMAQRTSPRMLMAIDCNEISLAETWRRLTDNSIPQAEARNCNVYDERLRYTGKYNFIYSRFLFQHLSEPLLALANIRRCLEETGRLCICDIDDQWLSVTPEPPEFRSLIDRAGRGQSARGGDRKVGTKLVHYLERAGYRDIRSSALLVSTDLIGKEAFCDLVFGYKLEVVPDSELETAKQEFEAVQRNIAAADGWGGLAVFFVSGRRGPDGVKSVGT